MKTYNKTFLPDSITYNGEVFKLNSMISGGMNASRTNPKQVIEALKSTGKRGILVNVMSKNLKGKTDLHGKPYQPSKFIFTN